MKKVETQVAAYPLGSHLGFNGLAYQLTVRTFLMSLFVPPPANLRRSSFPERLFLSVSSFFDWQNRVKISETPGFSESALARRAVVEPHQVPVRVAHTLA
jgi:hypothetical protein